MNVKECLKRRDEPVNGTLEGRTAVVTGAGRGIGREIALLFAREGADVVLAARTRSQIESVAEQIRTLGGNALEIQTDITDEAQVESMARKTMEVFGRIDILVNNAGANAPGPVADTQVKDWDMILDGFLKGTFLCSRAVLPVMKDQGKGHIINISSIAGKRGVATAAPYSASKFGVIGFSQALALEVKDFGVKVSVICPGRVDNPNWDRMPGVDRSKMLKPSDVAQAVLFVAAQPQRAGITELVIRPFPEDPV